MTRLRLAVVGAGHLGRIHARIAAALDDVQLVAVVDPLESSRNEVAEATGARPLAHHHELFGLADAAVIATPTTHHAQVARELLRGGIHLLVEKPLTASSFEAEELVTLARRQQLVLQVGHVERFNPAFTAVREKLVDPKYIEARRTSTYTFRSTDIGVVLDLMIHDIDLVLNLVQSPVVRVEALGVSVLGDAEDMVNARLTFASGCVANLTAARVSYKAERSMQVITPQCCASLDFAAKRAMLVQPRAEVLQREFRLATLSAEQKQLYREHLFEQLLPTCEVDTVEVNAIEEEQRDFAAAIRTSTNPQVTGADGAHAVEVSQRVLQAVAEHAWDGQDGNRRGPFAMPESASLPFVESDWSTSDTVVIRRKAG